MITLISSCSSQSQSNQETSKLPVSDNISSIEIDSSLRLKFPSGVRSILEDSHGKNAGIYVKTTASNIAYIRINSPNGVTVSQQHPGDDEWHFLSMSNLVNTGLTIDTRLEINNTTGAPVKVYVTAPTFTYGNQSPKIDPKPVTSAGGVITETLTNSMIEFDNNANFITLPHEGNVFFDYRHDSNS